MPASSHKTKPPSVGIQRFLMAGTTALEEAIPYGTTPVIIENHPHEPEILNDLFVLPTDDTLLLALSLFSDTAYRQPVAHYVAHHPLLHKVISETTRADIELSLHEAIANAVIHGNFATGIKRCSVEDFEQHYLHIEQCLSQPSLCTKRVDIIVTADPLYLSITVSDAGSGYSLDSLQATTHDSLHGRGLSLIQRHASSVHHQHLGRSITMTFPTLSNQPMHAQTFSERHKRAKLLIVDDTEFNQVILQNILEESGFDNLIFASNGQEALEKMAAHAIDLVVLDLVMPVMDGFAFTTQLRQMEQFNNVPIIAQTAMTNSDERLRVFASGCNDLIAKPINPKELNSRIKMHLDYRFTALDLLQSNERIRQELALAHAMQDDLLPSTEALKNLQHSHGLVVTGFNAPCSEIGGDIWYIQPISNHQIAFYTLDIAGHGVTAALNAFRIHTMINLESLCNEPLSVFTAWLNRKICTILQPGQFATFFCGVIDNKANTLSYITAACPSAIYSTGNTSRALSGEGLPLGVVSDASYGEQVLPFGVGDRLLVYSDALTETPAVRTGEFLSEAALIQEMEAYAEQYPDAQTRDQALQQRFLSLLGYGKTMLNDDLTMVFITRER